MKRKQTKDKTMFKDSECPICKKGIANLRLDSDGSKRFICDSCEILRLTEIIKQNHIEWILLDIEISADDLANTGE